MEPITRRTFITGAAALAGAALLPACASNGSSKSSSRPRSGKLPHPSDAPFDTVVLLMMENRSFDHLLGGLPGVDGKQAGLQYPDLSGKLQPTWELAPDWQGWGLGDPAHDWPSVARQFDGGRCDGFLRTQTTGDHYPIGYYKPGDLPVLHALARDNVVLDHYFCSLMGPTWPNRFYMHSAATDVDVTGLYPYLQDPTVLPPPGVARPSKLDLAIWDRLHDKGLSGGYYFFSEPMTGLYQSRRYDDISHHYDQFKADAAAGRLPNVTFVDPDFGTIAELEGTSNDMHPHGSVLVGDAFIGEVYDALRASPQWDRMVFVLTFDEHGGFYDHVPPPTVRDDNVNPNPGPHPDYSRLGFRVPCVVGGPFAPARVEHAGPYEHCSILRMIEWRFGLEPMHARDRYARNLAEVLDLSHRRKPTDVPHETPPPTTPRPANAPL
ncbi:MAG TPA: alkaline phosphatase family protein [Acidimicrobiia bacterium]|nr:alkaline phosphatase family protein [Acidimicrobiia bacterium]